VSNLVGAPVLLPLLTAIFLLPFRGRPEVESRRWLPSFPAVACRQNLQFRVYTSCSDYEHSSASGFRGG
jgi:hypothetical protein